MHPYFQKALSQFDNIVPSKHEVSHYPYVEPKYKVKK